MVRLFGQWFCCCFLQCNGRRVVTPACGSSPRRLHPFAYSQVGPSNPSTLNQWFLCFLTVLAAITFCSGDLLIVRHLFFVFMLDIADQPAPTSCKYSANMVTTQGCKDHNDMPLLHTCNYSGFAQHRCHMLPQPFLASKAAPSQL